MTQPGESPDRRDFPGAPPGSYVCEEGWLIVGDEAWTPQEWASGWFPHPRSGDSTKYTRRYDTAEERVAARRQAGRESKRRARAGLPRLVARVHGGRQR